MKINKVSNEPGNNKNIRQNISLKSAYEILKKLFKQAGLLLLYFAVMLLLSEVILYEMFKHRNAERFRIINQNFRDLGLAGENEDVLKFDRYRRFVDFESQINPDIISIVGKEYNKAPVALFGGSFATGGSIPPEEAFQPKISRILERPVYNFAFGGGGVQHIYYELNNDAYTQSSVDFEYVVYVFINDHIQRQYRYQFWNEFAVDENLRYKIKDGQITRIKPKYTLFWSLYTVKAVQILIKNIKEADHKQSFSDFITMIKNENKLIKEKWPNSHFIILTYSYKNDHAYDYIRNCDWTEIKKEGITVVDTCDLLGHNLEGDKYYATDKFHPSGLAWDEITPAFAEFLKTHFE